MSAKKTCLHDRHVALGARMAPFGGYDMPIQYAGILREHEATRREVTLFDTCHMGEFLLSGPTALEDLERLVSCDVSPLDTGQCRYGMLCNERGGVIDDLLVYRLAADSFMLVVNAGTQDGDFDWIRRHLSLGTSLENRSEQTAKIDIQGPHSVRLVARLLDTNLEGLRFYRFRSARYRQWDILLSRTGYTGEIGFEFYGPPEAAQAFWDDGLDNGASPAGLGARDTLRLEMGMPLYGHELGRDRPAHESGFTRALSRAKSFIGSDALRSPPRQRLVGLEFEGRRSARQGDRVLNGAGDAVGKITSGSFAPSLGHAVALAYIDADAADATLLHVQTARKALPARVASRPFYAEATGRRPLSDFL